MHNAGRQSRGTGKFHFLLGFPPALRYIRLLPHQGLSHLRSFPCPACCCQVEASFSRPQARTPPCIRIIFWNWTCPGLLTCAVLSRIRYDSLLFEPPGSPRVLEWVAVLFFRGSSWLKDWTGVFTIWATRKALLEQCLILNNHSINGVLNLIIWKFSNKFCTEFKRRTCLLLLLLFSD